DPFFQGKARSDAAVKGTGLGLAIVREYVAAHGGKVDILDSRGQGAHFQVRLPTAAAAAGR
ncbi:MAG TPA: ATP-binding protein, partial [Burkholderiales bacterium]|nr:ATP-binding protein [Burkholderiales bacterium]